MMPKGEKKAKKVTVSPKAINTQPEDKKGQWKAPPPREEPIKKMKTKKIIESATVVKKVDLPKVQTDNKQFKSEIITKTVVMTKAKSDQKQEIDLIKQQLE